MTAGKKATARLHIIPQDFNYWVDGFSREKTLPISEKPPIEGVPNVHYRLAGGTVGAQAGQ